MVAYDFQAWLAPAVSSGQKTTTIRAPRKDNRHAKPGDRLQLFTGMRTKACRKLVDPDPTCAHVEAVTIDRDGIRYSAGVECSTPDVVAQRNGFADFEAMAGWIKEAHGLPFSGFLI
ncbi:MAG: hypothetical protein GY717_06670 [Rhodobacteraceae bacterium]|nr:hypothetical protein [Paracoccaceae bacterium]